MAGRPKHSDIEELLTLSTVRPRLRGIPDVLATFLALPAAWWLTQTARPGLPRLAAAVYGLSLIMLFGVSASYHTVAWSLPARILWRRFDHGMVYVLIAGTYTPICLTALAPAVGHVFLLLVWLIAVAGVLKSFVWIHAPRRLNVLIYLGMGWLILPLTPAVLASLGWGGFALLLGGGLIYSAGAAVYARRWPDPAPHVFGYHELFHLFVIAAAGCHFVMVWHLLT